MYKFPLEMSANDVTNEMVDTEQPDLGPVSNTVVMYQALPETYT